MVKSRERDRFDVQQFTKDYISNFVDGEYILMYLPDIEKNYEERAIMCVYNHEMDDYFRAAFFERIENRPCLEIYDFQDAEFYNQQKSKTGLVRIEYCNRLTKDTILWIQQNKGRVVVSDELLRESRLPQINIFAERYVEALGNGVFGVKRCIKDTETTVCEQVIRIDSSNMESFWAKMMHDNAYGKCCCDIDDTAGWKYYEREKRSCNFLGVYRIE